MIEKIEKILKYKFSEELNIIETKIAKFGILCL